VPAVPGQLLNGTTYYSLYTQPAGNARPTPSDCLTSSSTGSFSLATTARVKGRGHMLLDPKALTNVCPELPYEPGVPI
jgi:hypothetical protein